MKPDEILQSVCHALTHLSHVADAYDGLFPSLIDPVELRMLEQLPPAIPGQRQGDRSHPGSNLIHDQAALKTMYALGAVLDRADLVQAADRYLEHFAARCTDTATGLFPWGEHAFWHLLERRVGSSRELGDPPSSGHATHDHLRQVPVWLWDRLNGFRPECVQRFADGLDFHWTEGEPPEYIRHGPIETLTRPARGARSCDFPRHGGFYILDWAYAYREGGAPRHLVQIQRMVDYWWGRRDERGLLLIESRSPADQPRFYNINAPGQTLSLAASLLESIPLLQGHAPDELCRTMHQRALAYVDGFLAAPHEPDAGRFVILSDRATNTATETMPIWGSVYGIWPASYVALTALCGYRLTSDRRLLDWASSVARFYAEEPIPEGTRAPAMDAGLGLGLLADLYDITRDPAWLDSALAMAARLIPVYCAAKLPVGAAGIDWYESQMGPSFLLHGMARTALLALDADSCPLDADYTAR
jgi:hypothetical protein